MLETREQIDLTLSYCGEDIVFPYATLLAIPGHQVGNVQSYDSPYDMDIQEFSFQVGSQEALALGVTNSDSFTYTLNNKDYFFTILSIVDDLLGWLELRVKFTGVLDNV